jgi:DNA polymerase epsilon subunit 1
VKTRWLLTPPEEFTIEIRWNIQTFLPLAIQDDFGAVVQFFIVELFKIRQKHNEGSRAPFRVLRNLAPELTQPGPSKINEIDATREFIARKLTRKSLRLIGTIQAKQRDA